MGAVLQEGEIEERYKEEIPELGLGAKITERSPVELHGWLARLVARIVVTDKRFKSTGKLHSDAKIELFYKSIVLLFSLWFLATIFLVGVLVGDKPLVTYLILKSSVSICNG